MTIDLKDESQFTLERVRDLIASKNDSKSYQLRVTKSGSAFLSDATGNRDIENLSFRLETWQAGNDYVGIAASKDESWVRRIYECLKKNWPNPSSSYIDIY